MVREGRQGLARGRATSRTNPRWRAHLLEEIGLDPALVDAAIADPTTHDEVRAEHQRVVDSGGYGVPTLIFPDGQTLFGPVLLDPPTGDAAVRLWHAVTAWLEFPHLYELQRPEDRCRPTGDRRRSFTPYLAGRDWVSINRGEVIPFGQALRGTVA